ACAAAIPVGRAVAWQDSARQDNARQDGARPDASKSDDSKQDPKFSTSVSVVNVLATVRDKNGKLIHTLNQQDFNLVEDERPQLITYFSQQSDTPLTLGLLVDTSGSQARVLDRERNAAYEFLEHVMREDKDKAFIIHFSRDVELLQDLTSSRKELNDALHDLGTGAGRPTLNRRDSGSNDPRDDDSRGQSRGYGRGGTALYDAVLLGSDEIMRK